MGDSSQPSPARIFARPTADAIWLGPAQRPARCHLLSGPTVRLMIGPRSSGKSTLLASAQADLGRSATVLAARGPLQDASRLLTALLQSAGLSPWELSTTELRNLLTVFLQERRTQRGRAVVMIDDAHAITDEAWEELERLRAWQIDDAPALELVLVGGRELIESNAAHWLAEDDGRAAVHELPAPSARAIGAYIDWRLTQFGLDGLITPIAAQVIARQSGSRFAAVDLICQMSLLMLRQQGLERVDARVVRQAMAALASRRGPKAAESPSPSPAARQEGCVTISRDGQTVREVPLGQRLLVGRSEHNDVCLPSPYLGRHHAAIVGTPDGYYVVDLNSLNGVEVNGRRTLRAVLADQDVLALGPFRLRVTLPPPAAGSSPLPTADSLADTALLPLQVDLAPLLVRVK